MIRETALRFSAPCSTMPHPATGTHASASWRTRVSPAPPYQKPRWHPASPIAPPYQKPRWHPDSPAATPYQKPQSGVPDHNPVLRSSAGDACAPLTPACQRYALKPHRPALTHKRHHIPEAQQPLRQHSAYTHRGTLWGVPPHPAYRY